MQTIARKVQTAFRFDSELLRRLKIKAKQENRSLNNYVETVLMDIVYDEPNEQKSILKNTNATPPLRM